MFELKKIKHCQSLKLKKYECEDTFPQLLPTCCAERENWHEKASLISIDLHASAV